MCKKDYVLCDLKFRVSYAIVYKKLIIRNSDTNEFDARNWHLICWPKRNLMLPLSS